VSNYYEDYDSEMAEAFKRGVGMRRLSLSMRLLRRALRVLETYGLAPALVREGKKLLKGAERQGSHEGRLRMVRQGPGGEGTSG